MKISLDQPIGVSVEAAQAAFVDPSFYQSLGELSGISAPEVRSFSESAGHVRLVLGYRFVGQLNGPARRILDPSKITWSQETDVDLSARRTEVRMVPDNYQGLLSFSGWYELRSDGPDKCSQHFEGDLRIRLPLLGPLAERAIGGSIRENIAQTAHLVERFVSGGGAAGEGTRAERTGGEDTGGESPDTENPHTESPSTENPRTEKPAGDGPTGESPAGDSPAGESFAGNGGGAGDPGDPNSQAGPGPGA